jgi:hypothetical protein
MNAYKQNFRRYCLVVIGYFIVGTMLLGQIGVEIEDVACAGQSNGKITVSIESGIAGDFEYSKDGQTFQPSNVFDGLAPGSYLITVRDKQTMCKYSKGATVKGGVGLAVDIRGGGTFTFCSTEGPPTVVLTASASGGDGNYTFEGWPGEKREIKSTIRDQLLVVRDGNNCKGEAKWSVEIVEIVCSRDPNDIIGPDGYGDAKFVSIKDRLPYKIRFENDPEFASAPAQKVSVEHILDLDLNTFSLQLGSFGFANLIFEVPPNSTFYKKRLDVRDSLGIFVDITAGIDVTENKVFWYFESIDATTGLEPTDPLQGMLPINDTITRKGEGFVEFSVVPKISGETGDSIHAEAAIVFDVNETIETPEIFNVLDALPPTSSMFPLPAISAELAFPLFWTADDDPGGSGVRDYTLFVSENESDFYPYENGIEDTTIVFVGSPGSKYKFFVVATDHVGNVEQKRTAEAETEINPEAQLAIITLDKNSYCLGDSLNVQWASASIEALDVYLSSNGGATYEKIGEAIVADSASFGIKISEEFSSCEACILKIGETNGSIEDSIQFAVFANPEINVSEDIEICEGDFALLQVSDFEEVTWTPTLGLSDPTALEPIASPTVNTTYEVVGKDKNGCLNSAQVNVQVQPKSVTYLEEMVCKESLAGLFYDTLSNVFGCDSIIALQRNLDLEPPIFNPPDSLLVTIPNTGIYELTMAEIDPNLSDNCGIADVSISQSSFTCEDAGIAQIEVTVFDSAGLSSSSIIPIRISPSNVCTISIANVGGSEVSSPCTCIGEGWFSEEVVIHSLPGETWNISSTSLRNPENEMPYPEGTVLQEDISNPGVYTLSGIHRSAEGYMLNAVSTQYPGYSIAIENQCYYPSIEVVTLDSLGCSNGESIELVAQTEGIQGSGSFTIDGIVYDFYDPALLSIGQHEILYSFDAGLATPNDPNDPGCLFTHQQIVEIKPAGHPICKGSGPFFTYEYRGPDTLYADEDCEVLFDLSDNPITVNPLFAPDQIIESVEFSAELTGVDLNAEVFPGQILPATYIAMDNFGNTDTFVFQVVVIDNIPPLARCRDITLTLDESGMATIPMDTIDNNSFDGCGIDRFISSQNTFDTSDIGLNEVILEVTDLSGNVGSCTSIVTVEAFSTSIIDLPDYVESFALYPNPTMGNAILEMKFSKPMTPFIEIYNQLGELAYRFVESDPVGMEYRKELPMENLPPGTYSLVVGEKSGSSFQVNIVRVK